MAVIATTPLNNAERLEALYRYGILDTPVEPDFDAMTALAAEICEVPVALITFVDRERQWFKSSFGLANLRETPLDFSACAHAILQPDVLVVPDTLLDERFANNPLVTGKPHVRFYAGALLKSPEGHPLGTMCVMDFKPRLLTDSQRNLLSLLARQVMNMLEIRRQTEIQCASQAALEEELECRKEIMAVVTHDLRSPLTVIKMIAHLAAEDHGSGDFTVPQLAEILKESVEDMERLIADLSDYSVVETGQLSMDFEVRDVREIFDKIERTFSIKAGDVGISLRRTEPLAEPVNLLCDRGRLCQALGNLILNSIKFTEPGGEIFLDLSVRDEMVVLSVTDTGKGIPAASMSRIFDRFWTQSGTEKGGRGIGLTIVQGIVSAHGGKIFATSEEDVGTCFSIVIPLTAETLA